MLKNKMVNLKVAMITHYQSSGSLYLHSLLDGHPEIITIPGVLSLNSILLNNYNFEEALNVFNKENPSFYDTSKESIATINTNGLYRLGQNSDEGIITNKIEFKKYFFEYNKNKNPISKNIILSLYYAYAKVHGEDIKNKKVILFHPHSIYRTLLMNDIFPNSKYLVTIRDSARGYCSRLKRIKDKAKARNQRYIHIGLLYDDANNVYEFLKRNMSMRIIKVDDFERSSKFILEKLCKYLDIAYNPVLDISSFGSKLYWGANPNYKSNQFKISRHNKPLPLKRRELLLFEIINARLNNITGYKNIKPSWFENKLGFLWLFIPFQEDFIWFKYAFFSKDYKKLPDSSGHYPSSLIMILRLIKERLFIGWVLLRNFHFRKYYLKIEKSFLNINSSEKLP